MSDEMKERPDHGWRHGPQSPAGYPKSVWPNENEHQRTARKDTLDIGSTELADLHLAMSQLLTQAQSREEMLAGLCDIVGEQSKAGTVLVLSKKETEWRVVCPHDSPPMPDSADRAMEYQRALERAFGSGQIQIEIIAGQQWLFAPLMIEVNPPAVLAVATRRTEGTPLLPVLDTVQQYARCWDSKQTATEGDWKLQSLAALIELVSRIESQPSLQSACDVAAQELTRYLNCDFAAVATVERLRVRVRTVSGVNRFDQNSGVVRSLRTALSETAIRKELTVWRDAGESCDSPSLGHRQLAGELDVDSVTSIPLTNESGQCIGYLLLAGVASKEQDRLNRFLKAAESRIGSALQVVRRAQRSLLRRGFNNCIRFLGTIRAAIAVTVVVGIAALLCYPVAYRVRCGCRVDTANRRFVVAPFAGTIHQALVDTGEAVRAGQLLAVMDDQSIRYELASIQAERKQALKKRDIQLAERLVSDSILSDLDVKRLNAREQLLLGQLEQLQLKSPIDGVILQGELSETNGMAVDLGRSVYEVGQLDELRIELNVPSEDVAMLRTGCSVRIWIEGQNASIAGTVERIRPRSELRDGKNVFVAEAALQDPDQQIRPGMKGYARIDCDPQPLGWNVFHKPWEFCVSRLTWW